VGWDIDVVEQPQELCVNIDRMTGTLLECPIVRRCAAFLRWRDLNARPRSDLAGLSPWMLEHAHAISKIPAVGGFAHRLVR